MAPSDGQVCHSFALTKPVHLPHPARSWCAQVTSRVYSERLHQCSASEIWFPAEVFIKLKQMVEALKENERWVCLLHDEIGIKSGLVCDGRSGELGGFAHTQRTGITEDNLATHAPVFMVVGITSNIKMSIGYFPTRTATSDQIFPLLWKVVGLLERCLQAEGMCGRPPRKANCVEMLPPGELRLGPLRRSGRWR